jgi:hypothetical protein
MLARRGLPAAFNWQDIGTSRWQLVIESQTSKRASLLSKCSVEIENRIEGEMNHVTIVLNVMYLITGKCLRIVYLDQCVAAPTRSVSLDVTHARLDSTPITALCERLKRTDQASSNSDLLTAPRYSNRCIYSWPMT